MGGYRHFGLNRVFSCLLCLLLLIQPIVAQESAQESPQEGTQESEDSSESEIQVDPNIILQDELEELSFIDGLRRFEIVFFGSLPFTILFTSLGYSIGRYLYHGINSGFASTAAQNNVPMLFDPSSFSSDERGWVLLGAVGVSLGLAIIDIIIEAVRRSEGL